MLVTEHWWEITDAPRKTVRADWSESQGSG